jgi:hypothetical protein
MPGLSTLARTGRGVLTQYQLKKLGMTKCGYSKKLEFKKSLLSLTHFGGIFS